MNDLGVTLEESRVKAGLKELNPDIHFDMGTKLGQWHPYQATRQGVFYNGVHICSMDRGVIPEFKVWSVAERVAPASLLEADRDDVSVTYKEITPGTPGYSDLYDAAARGKYDNLVVREGDGKLIEIMCHRVQKVRDKVVSVGWRHTFERLILAKINGITRESLHKKFNVDMYKYVNAPADIVSAVLCEE